MALARGERANERTHTGKAWLRLGGGKCVGVFYKPVFHAPPTNTPSHPPPLSLSLSVEHALTPPPTKPPSHLPSSTRQRREGSYPHSHAKLVNVRIAFSNFDKGAFQVHHTNDILPTFGVCSFFMEPLKTRTLHNYKMSKKLHQGTFLSRGG